VPLFLPNRGSTSGSGGFPDALRESKARRNIPLIFIGVRNYRVGEIFVRDSFQVYHNGRRLKLATDGTPITGEYFLSESGGVGTGFDTVNLVGFTPNQYSILFADYFVP
jgi:hypothetical protein